MDDAERKRETTRSFGRAPDGYRVSGVHRAGDDLDLLAAWCADATTALDVACGAGHTAGALAASGARRANDSERASNANGGTVSGERASGGSSELASDGVPRVVAADATPAMVETATETFDCAGCVADAERLPFADAAFDAVTCRIAAHHFPNPRAFVREVSRVLEPGGVFAFEDNVAPDDDRLADFLNRFESLRDPTHVEAYARETWDGWLRDAGFAIEESATMRRELDFGAWLDRTDPNEERREELRALVRRPEAEAAYGVSVEDGGSGEDVVRGFGNRKALIRARKRA